MTFENATPDPSSEAAVPEVLPGPSVVVGDSVVADDGAVGRVEQILRSETNEPMFVVVAVRSRLRRRYPVLPLRLLGRVDRRRDVVHARGRCASIKQFSEELPLLV